MHPGGPGPPGPACPPDTPPPDPEGPLACILKSGRPRGPGGASKSVGGVAPLPPPPTSPRAPPSLEGGGPKTRSVRPAAATVLQDHAARRPSAAAARPPVAAAPRPRPLQKMLLRCTRRLLSTETWHRNTDSNTKGLRASNKRDPQSRLTSSGIVVSHTG